MDIVEPHNTAETKCEPNTEQRGDDGKKLVEELVKIVSRLLLMIFFWRGCDLQESTQR